MGMQWLEGELRKTGNKQDKLNADFIAAMLKHRGKDIRLPQSAVEAPTHEVVRFSAEAREALEKDGYRVYQLTGQTIKTLRDSGKRFWSTWPKDYPDFEAMPSRTSEVAINPNSLFLLGTNSQTLLVQENMVKEWSLAISANIPGVQAVLGEAADYAELAFAHLGATGQRLFGEEFDYNYTRTKTRVGSDVASVGDFYADRGLHVDGWIPDLRNDFLFAAPLVVPAESK